ncbi:MAG: flavodoxin family protein [Erysipelotrichaceae bacterium]|nr:flavodoxin family protein [Erysipelotrichaceae bacterium]
MKLVIHDLQKEEWEKFSKDYRGWKVISEKPIRPCNGCFCCWHKTPGQCVIKDGFENMGKLIHVADEITVISRYTYGGFSSFIKNVFDRCLGYVLPQFEVVQGETHHKRRYDEDKPFSFVFYGKKLNEEEKESARRYVKAVCANIRGHVKEVRFKETLYVPVPEKRIPYQTYEKAVLLNPSMRSTNANSYRFAKELSKKLKKEHEIVNMQQYQNEPEKLMQKLESAPIIVLCTPLYVDGLPSQLIRLMERFEKEYHGLRKKIYVLANMGLYESSQLENLFEAVKQWCTEMGFEYCGGLGISAGELIGTLIQHIRLSSGPGKKNNRGMKKLAKAINTGSTAKDIYTEPFFFPRSLYIHIANSNWNTLAKRNGLKPEDLYRQV